MTKVVMIQKRIQTAMRLAFYPAFEPAAKKRFEALTMEAENARGAGDLAKAEKLYLTAMAEARASSDPSHLDQIRYGLARVYQEQRRYREAEHIFRAQLEEALNSSQPNAQVHASHMCLARLYQEEGKSAEAEEHYKAAVVETEGTEVWPGRGFFGSTSMWLAKFYVVQSRYREAEPLFQRVLEIYEADRSLNSCLPHHLEEFARLHEAQEKYVAAEAMYRRALKMYEELDDCPPDLLTVWALDNLAAFCRKRGRYHEAEELCRRSLVIVEERVRTQAGPLRKGWLRWRNRKELDAKISHLQIPISAALEKLAEVYECQEKYAEAVPLWRRSVEIKERAWEANSWLWVDSLAAYANALHKIGLEQEATEIDERVEAIRTKYPQGSVHTSLRFMSMPVRRNLRWRFTTFVNALLHPSPR